MKFVHSINNSLEKMLRNHKEIILYGEDLLDPYGGAFKVTRGLSTKFPNRVLPTPISEAAMIGMAGGMAIGGLRPILEIMFGDFLSLIFDGKVPLISFFFLKLFLLLFFSIIFSFLINF